MNNINFLNYYNPKHLAKISIDCVRNTDGINSSKAVFCMTANGVKMHNTEAEIDFFIPEKIIVSASIDAKKSETKNVRLFFSDSIKIFKPIDIFPLQNELVSKIDIHIKNIISADGKETKFGKEFFDKIIEKNTPLFSRSFYQVESDKDLKISQNNLTDERENIAVKNRLSLWCLGGNYQETCELDKIESVFIYPKQKTSNPNELEIETFTFSQIITKDPGFASGKSKKLFCAQGEIGNWNLVDEVLKGNIQFELPSIKKTETEQKIIFKSVKIEKENKYSHDVLITFVRQESDSEKGGSNAQ